MFRESSPVGQSVQPWHVLQARCSAACPEIIESTSYNHSLSSVFIRFEYIQTQGYATTNAAPATI